MSGSASKRSSGSASRGGAARKSSSRRRSGGGNGGSTGVVERAQTAVSGVADKAVDLGERAVKAVTDLVS